MTGNAAGARRSRYGEGDVLGGKFRVIRTLGAGGMGIVYEVQHVLTFHKRALKLLLVNDGTDLDSQTDDESASARLLREASAAGRIGNPHIVETFDAGLLPSGETYVVMELLEGESLADLLRRRVRMPVEDATDLVLQACVGLQAAHDAGIIHRDLKPGNLWVAQRDGRPFVKILDFGISRFDPKLTDETELTQEGAVLGTPSYMSPEQLSAGPIDARVDVYAMGVVLYLALTGQRPYGGGSLLEMMRRMSRGERTPLGELRPDVPEGLVAVVDRAIAPDRAARTPTARQLAEELTPFARPGHALRAPGAALPEGGGSQAAPLPAAPAAPRPEATPQTRRARAAIVVGLAGAAILALSAVVLFHHGRAATPAVVLESVEGSGVAAPTPAANAPAPGGGTASGEPRSGSPSAAVTEATSARASAPIVPPPALGRTSTPAASAAVAASPAPTASTAPAIARPPSTPRRPDNLQRTNPYQ